jgi:hypothetical protein
MTRSRNVYSNRSAGWMISKNNNSGDGVAKVVGSTEQRNRIIMVNVT